MNQTLMKMIVRKTGATVLPFIDHIMNSTILGELKIDDKSKFTIMAAILMLLSFFSYKMT